LAKIFFNKFITKDLTAIETDRRLFEGYLTVQMVDKQNEITVESENVLTIFDLFKIPKEAIVKIKEANGVYISS